MDEIDKSEVAFEKGDLINPPVPTDEDEKKDALPQQEEFWRPPIRFGSVPVEKEPLGWDRRRGFRKLYPRVSLPFQVVDRVSFGHSELEPNRLFWGDNLHIMRQLPPESIDLIYIDPPFFSGRDYNVIFGDQNELRSFSDIWESGMPGYLIWLNARLYEMKRLLKKTGTIFVHCDYHASHYIKVEMDKIYGHDRLLAEIIWHKNSGSIGKSTFSKRHDVIFQYSKSQDYYYDGKAIGDLREQEKGTFGGYFGVNEEGREYREVRKAGKVYRYFMDEPRNPEDVWKVPQIPERDKMERIGYPTQKPLELIQRIIDSSCPEDGVIADFFMGGGTTIFAASGARVIREKVTKQKRDGTTEENVKRYIAATAPARRWIGCDQSRVAVAITADRVTNQIVEQTGRMFPVPDFTIEHWGVYEASRLADAPSDQFRAFVLRSFGAVLEEREEGIHGYKGAIPVWVGAPSQKIAVTSEDVQGFANAMRKTIRYRQDNLRDGIILAWAFRPDAVEAAERLRRLEQTDLNFIRLDMIRIDSQRFREHVSALSTTNADYQNFLTFVQPPKVEVGHRRIVQGTYKFDVSETVVMNSGAKIINVQWDFDFEDRFSSTPGYAFARTGKKEVALTAEYTFPYSKTYRIACKVQDDMGGEGIWSGDIEIN